MRFLLLNQDWFKEELRQAGHEVLACGQWPHLDVPVTAPLVHIDSIIKKLPWGAPPDVIVVLDNSSPILFCGLDETEIPVIFYSVDTHHHANLHSYLHNIFDHTFIAQKDFDGIFRERGQTVDWLPLYASQYVEVSPEKSYGAVFVGTLNPTLNPGRVRFFEQLCARAPVFCTTGAFQEIFPRSEIVVNQTVKGDLNFRVFEAMMCGALLLTERSGNGLLEIFEDGKHLVCYQKDNVEEAADKISRLLGDLPRCREIAAAGRAEILAKHLPVHRAERILEVALRLKKRTPHPLKFMSSMVNFAVLGARLEKHDTALAARSLVFALKAAETGLMRGEAVPEDIATYLTYAAVKYDLLLKSQSGHALLELAGERAPEVPMIACARMRALLNQGRMAEAETIARRFGSGDPRTIFSAAEEAVNALLSSTDVQ